MDNWCKIGNSKDKETPPNKKVNRGKTINRPIEIEKTGICLPWFSCNFFA